MAGPNSQLMKVGAGLKLGKNPSAPLKKYIETTGKSVAGAIGTWQSMAMFKDLKIMAVVALGTRGCLSGPSLAPFIKASAPMSTEWERKMSKAVASAVAAAWSKYEKSVTVPGLPWYPSFAAFPGPMAPPTPNIPWAYATLPQDSMSKVQGAIKNGIKQQAKGLAHAEAVADAIAAGFGMMAMVWLTGVMVKNVLGKGPVPSFAPPYVPVGPVVAGDNIAVPGHLAV